MHSRILVKQVDVCFEFAGYFKRGPGVCHRLVRRAGSRCLHFIVVRRCLSIRPLDCGVVGSSTSRVGAVQRDKQGPLGGSGGQEDVEDELLGPSEPLEVSPARDRAAAEQGGAEKKRRRLLEG